MMLDGLTDAYDRIAMGLSTERFNAKVGISRERQDALAAASHEKASAAIKEGRLAEEIVAVEVPQRKGDPILVDTDEGVRPGTTIDSLGALRPAFDKDGTITAGNSSQISDGACAVVVMSAERPVHSGSRRSVSVIGYGMVAGPDNSLLTQPSRAITKAARKAGVEVDAVDLFEIDEGLATVGLASMDNLGIDEAKVNVNGGAIALGHPVGMSGTRVALTALLEAPSARRFDGGRGPLSRRRPGRRRHPAADRLTVPRAPGHAGASVRGPQQATSVAPSASTSDQWTASKRYTPRAQVGKPPGRERAPLLVPRSEQAEAERVHRGVVPHHHAARVSSGRPCSSASTSSGAAP